MKKTLNPIGGNFAPGCSTIKQTDMDELQKWFLEHEEADSSWEEIVSGFGSDDYLLSAEGFEKFHDKIKKEYPWWRRALRATERVAAILLAPVVAVAAFLAFRQPEKVQWSEAYTLSGQTRIVTLPDGSVIRLAPESRIMYPSAFNKDLRQVFLVGEAYADITHMDDCPFEIHSEDITVTVFGTEFNFSSYPSDSECELALVDGSVEMKIDAKGANHDIQMKTGDMVRYTRSTGSVEKQRFSTDTFLSNARKGGLQFSNRKMEDIARCLERRFGVNIIIEDEEIAQERFFASFINGEDLPTVLQALNTQNHMKIRKKGDNYFLSLY